MIEDVIKTLIQYGAIGALLAVYVVKDLKKSTKTNEILERIATIYQESIAHERNMSKDCYNKVVNKLDEHHSETMSEFQKVKHQIELKDKK
ncbi:MAG: hypothetical protein AB7D29_07745 [Campylobacterales bacterium]